MTEITQPVQTKYIQKSESKRRKLLKLALNKRVFLCIIIFCQTKKEKVNMLYFQHCLANGVQNQALYSYNFLMPFPYPYIMNGSFSQNFPILDAKQTILKKQPFPAQTQVGKGPEKIEENSLPDNKIQQQASKTGSSFPQKEQLRMSREFASYTDTQGKIHVRIEWRNQNRNIIPNIMNQLLSYLTKPFKSKKIINHIFNKQKHQASWTPKRYYNYLKIIKEKTSHYLDQSDLKTFFAIQSPHCEIYPYEQQEFYMKICRILVSYFLKNEVILIATTSTRMNEYNRKIHLVGREVLIKIFEELANQFKSK